MAQQFAIEIRPEWKPEDRVFVRVYQNQREWVVRAHAKTATHFSTREAAQAIIDKFDLGKHKASIVVAI